ncbi:hypothetical protein CBL_10625 [Carabus blaptoides fortunei]
MTNITWAFANTDSNVRGINEQEISIENDRVTELQELIKESQWQQTLLATNTRYNLPLEYSFATTIRHNCHSLLEKFSKLSKRRCHVNRFSSVLWFTFACDVEWFCALPSLLVC